MSIQREHTTIYANKFVSLAIVIGALVVLFVIVTLLDAQQVASPQPVKQPATKIFQDPAEHYTLMLPSSWQTNAGYGKQKTGIGTAHEQSFRVEVTNLAYGTTGINIGVYEATPVCNPAEKPNTTLAGFPAYFNSEHSNWTIKTTKATYVIGYYYPGLAVFHGKLSRGKPSQGEMDKNLHLVSTVIGSLKLFNEQPLICL